MMTVCVCVQSAQKCLVSWTIFQMEDNSLSLSELFENIKSGRVSIIVLSSELSMAQLEKVFIGKSKQILTNIDPSIQICDVLVSFGQFIRYNVVIHVTTPISVGVTTLVQPSIQHVKNVNVMVQCEDCLSWRFPFSKKKLTNMQQRTLEAILDDVSYSCGASFEDIEFSDGLESVCIRDHNCEKGCVILLNIMPFVITVHMKMLPAKYHQMCIHCAEIALVKNMLRREVNKTYLMANLWSCIHFIVLCTELSLL